jgi:hypothetical protein
MLRLLREDPRKELASQQFEDAYYFQDWYDDIDSLCSVWTGQFQDSFPRIVKPAANGLLHSLVKPLVFTMHGLWVL